MVDLELRREVAIVCGYTNIRKYSTREPIEVLVGDLPDRTYCTILPYDFLTDAIAEEFAKRGWLFFVHNRTEAKTYKAVADSGLEFEAPTMAIALCKLFLALHKAGTVDRRIIHTSDWLGDK
jgi:hypothetical protein